MMIKDYPYVGVDFRGDPEFILLEGEQWDDVGKKNYHFGFFKFYNFFSKVKD